MDVLHEIIIPLIVGHCFFCEKLLIRPEITKTTKEREIFSLSLGTQPNRMGGQIGKIKICQDCLSELKSLLTTDSIL